MLRRVVRPDGRAVVVLRCDGDKLTLADMSGREAHPRFAPAPLDRLATFALEAAAGNPVALEHPKAIDFLATLALAALAMVDACPQGRTGEGQDNGEE